MYFLKYIYFYAGCFYLFFGSLILVFRKFFIQSKVFPDFKKVKNHCNRVTVIAGHLYFQSRDQEISRSYTTNDRKCSIMSE